MDAFKKKLLCVAKWELLPYALPMQHPTLQERRGLLLRLEDDRRNVGWGEISPFPGLNRESLDQARLQTLDVLEGKLSLDHLFPSVEFGVESALLDLESREEEKIPISALLLGSPEQILQRAEKALLQGFTTAKVKIGDLTLSDARFVLQELQGKFLLRLDINRKWPLKKTLTLLDSFDPAVFDYIEEPVDQWSDLHNCPLPFALDESLHQLKNGEAIPDNLKAIIIKPTVIGGRNICGKWRLFAEKHKLQMILSSTYESAVGLSQIARLAHDLKLSNYTHGLGTHSYWFHPNGCL